MERDDRKSSTAMPGAEARTAADGVVGNASRNLVATINGLNPVLRGWTSYFRLTEVKSVLYSCIKNFHEENFASGMLMT